MDLIKKTVMHKSFGQGTIIECSDSYVAVQFESGIKEFVYPDAFDRYLKLVDKKAADSVDKILEKLESAKVISAINPHYFSLLRLVVDEGSELAEDIEKGKFQLLTPLQILDENIILLENIELTDCIFRANHVSNLVNLAGTLNQDRDMLINKLKRVRENPNFIPYTYNGL
jgi:hypothetical protein